MPLYLTRFSYTPETWSQADRRTRRIAEPRRRTYIEAVGGQAARLLVRVRRATTPTTCGKRPTTCRWLPSRWRSPAVARLASSRRPCLLTVEETMDALQQARGIRYRPPGAS